MGVLPSQSIRKLISKRIIFADKEIEKNQIQPASLDLRLGQVAWRVRASFLTGKEKNVSDLLDEFKMHQIDMMEGSVLEKGCVYLIPIEENLSLPSDLSAVANAKSSTGRLDLLTRIITNKGIEFDRIPAGYKGKLFVEICPRSFSVLVRPGMRLNQIRFRQYHAVLTDKELLALHNKEKLIDSVPKIDGGLGFSVDLKPEKGSLVGYQAKPHTGIIDLNNVKTYNREDFWQEVHSSDSKIILDPDAFYILVSKESVHIPPAFAAEMAPYLAMVGEFRVHYAGFFDPGFGHADAGGSGSRGVLEVRCHEAPFVLEHGQIVGRLVYEKMAEIPEELYGQTKKRKGIKKMQQHM